MLKVILALALWTSSLTSNRYEAERMSEQYFPPWRTTTEETSVPAGPMFSACERALEAFAASTGDKVADRQYSLNKHWGYILRARLVSEVAGSPVTTLLNCWSQSGANAHMAATVETDDSP